MSPDAAAIMLQLLLLLPQLQQQSDIAGLDAALGIDGIQAAPKFLRAQAALMRQNLELHTLVIAKYEELANAIEESQGTELS